MLKLVYRTINKCYVVVPGRGSNCFFSAFVENTFLLLWETETDFFGFGLCVCLFCSRQGTRGWRQKMHMVHMWGLSWWGVSLTHCSQAGPRACRACSVSASLMATTDLYHPAGLFTCSGNLDQSLYAYTASTGPLSSILFYWDSVHVAQAWAHCVIKITLNLWFWSCLHLLRGGIVHRAPAPPPFFIVWFCCKLGFVQV